MTAVALTLMLSACGDDGKGNKTSATANSKTAAPAPTPSPSPSPARTYTYDKIDFKADRSFIGYDRLSGTKQGDEYKSFEFSSSDTGVVSYATANGKVTLPDSADLAHGGVIDTASGATVSVGTGVYVEKEGFKLKFGKPDHLDGYDYFATAFYDDSTQGRGFLFGYPTNPAELGGADVRTYLALIDESENDQHGVELAPLTVDFSKSTITGTIPRVDGNKAVGVYQLSGAIDANKHLTGSLNSQNGKISGEFRGRLFGPGGKEIALVAYFKSSDGTTEVGLLTGKLK
ncbi:transferrin-binding protein-like solute binding protein [Sphingomonas sp. DT-51]|uniref:transferrin-binding protein-like solute binding protein n=1 Tax=Sphingomonas sp. DT-51 TaxID=3396165 RepID=UPI003F1C8658